MKKLYLFALVATMFAACATDSTQEVAIDVAPETLTVSFEEDSRIQLNEEQKTVWTKNDLVSVFYRSNANQQWQYQGETGERTGELKQVAAPTSTQELSKVVVVYPYSESYYINPETCDVEATLPATQHYLKDSYGLNGNIMISSSYYNQFSLKSVCGWIKVQLKGDGQIVKKMTIKGNSGEQVAGQLYINSADATITLASNMGGVDDDENSAGGNLVFDNTIIKEVTLDCGEGVTLSNKVATFYIALPPQTFEAGLTLNVHYGDGTTMTKTTTNSISISRNTILPMQTLYYDGNNPPVYEIAYATNDGMPLDPLTTDGFGSDFVENVFDAATSKGALVFSGNITTIPENAFISCENLTLMNIPTTVTSINAGAFNNCKSLSVLDIPQGVTTIGDKAFYNCSGMNEITIPKSVTSWKYSSFEKCKGTAYINCDIAHASNQESGKFRKAGFDEIVIGESVSTIGKYAFIYCENLAKVSLPNSVTTLGEYSFAACKSLSSIVIPENITELPSGVFQSSGLVSIIIPDNVSEIYWQAFYDCTNLKTVVIGDGVTKIYSDAFLQCTALTDVKIGKGLKSIGAYAFEECKSLERVEISDLTAWCGIEFSDNMSNPLNYGASLYLNDTQITELNIPSNVFEIKNYAFYGCASITSVTIPSRVSAIGESAFAKCASLSSFRGKFASPDNQCLIIDGVLNLFAPASTLTEYQIPDGVTAIGTQAFSSSHLISVTIPDSVTSIGTNAFCSKTLTNVFIGDGVTSIGYGAFWGSGLINVNIPESVTEIGNSAFRDCDNLEEVTIGSNVRKIDSDAFTYCDNLKTVYCKPVTPPSFSASDSIFRLSNATTIYVPTESVDAYKTDSYKWAKYASMIVGYDF